jgi:hypothetical protein
MQITNAHALLVDESGQRVSRQQFCTRVTDLMHRLLGSVLPRGTSATIQVSTQDADTLQVLVVARQPGANLPPSPGHC